VSLAKALIWLVPAAVREAVQPELAGAGGGLQAAVHAQLGQDIGHMHTGRLAADEQLLGDLPVALAGSK
jgi:hypothetical protein